MGKHCHRLAPSQPVPSPPPAPDPTHFTYVQIFYPVDTMYKAASKWQAHLASAKAERRFGGAARINNATGLEVAGPFLGSWQDALAWLEKAGLLIDPAPAPPTPPPPGSPPPLTVNYVATSPAPLTIPAGLYLAEYGTFAEVEARTVCTRLFAGSLAGIASWYVRVPGVTSACAGPFGVTPACPPIDCTAQPTLNAIIGQLALPNSPINRGSSELWQVQAGLSHFIEVGYVPESTLRAVVEVQAASVKVFARDVATAVVSNPAVAPFVAQIDAELAATATGPPCNADGLPSGCSPTTFEQFVAANVRASVNAWGWNHFVNGAVHDVPPSATPIPWRGAIGTFGFNVFDNTVAVRRTEALLFSVLGNNANTEVAAIVDVVKAAYAREARAYVAANFEALQSSMPAKATQYYFYNYMVREREERGGRRRRRGRGGG